jgi:omega-amidase
MTILCCQLDIAWENRDANHAKVRSLLRDARVRDGAMLVLPEMFASGFSLDVAKIAEGESRPTERFLADVAREHRIFIVAGVVSESSRTGRGVNEAIVIDPAGATVARYRKLHPFNFGDEGRRYDAGDRIVTFEWGGFVVAPFVCYDLRFPEIFRVATLKYGANLFLVIANWPRPREEHWLTLLRARAIENQAYVVGVNRVGRDPTNEYGGRSLVIGPRGDVILDAGEREGIFTADIEIAPLVEYRSQFPALRDARDDYNRL